MMTPTDVRLTLHQNGYAPLPLNGKAPPLKNWQQKLETNSAEIDLWGSTWPSANNTGILCRFAPCLDIDVLDPAAADAVEELVRARFEDGGYILPRIGRAPKRAIVFRTEEPFAKIQVPLIAPNGDTTQKLEFLSDGQQVVVDGIHPDTGKPYAWPRKSVLDIPHGELPYIREDEARQLINDAAEQLVAEFGYKRADRRDKKPDGDDDDGGERVDWAASVAAILRGEALHDNTVRLAASYIGSGLSAEHTLRQLRALMLASTTAHDERWQARFNDLRRIVGDAEAKFGGEESAPAAEPSGPNDGSAEGFAWTLFCHGDPMTQNTQRRWLVEGFLPQSGVGLISGQWGTFKTFTALDLAAAVMTGTAFIRYPVSCPGGVLLLANEGQNEVDTRLSAAWEAHGGSGRAPFVWVPKTPRLLDPKAGKILIAMIRHAQATLEREAGVPLVLVLIDALGKAAGYTRAGDENDAAMVKRIMKALADAAQATGVLILGLTHFGKAVETGTRGSSAYEDDADTVLALIGDRSVNGQIGNTRLCLRKSRSGQSGDEFVFRTRGVVVGSENTLAIDWHAAADQTPPPTSKRTDGWAKKSLRLLRQMLMNVLVDCGKEIRPWANGPMVRAVDLELVRGQFYRGYPAAEATDEKSKASARRQAFGRAINDAKASNLIGSWVIEGVTYIWLLDPTPAQGEMGL
jgi:hypothetical protein